MKIRRKFIDILLPEHSWPEPSCRETVMDDIEKFINLVLREAPFHVRVGEKFLAIFLYLWLIIQIDMRFSKKSHFFDSEHVLQKFSNLSNLNRRLIRLYRSLIILSFFEHPIVIADSSLKDANS